MGRAPCCDKANVKRGSWSPEEDAILKRFIESNGNGGNWITLPKKAGLNRCGKSCRLRWLNYLKPDIKHGSFTEEEDSIIFNLYNQVGSRWSVIASRLPSRTDNEIKNYWNTRLKKKIVSSEISKPKQFPELDSGSSSAKSESGHVSSDSSNTNVGSSMSQEYSNINSANSPIDNGLDFSWDKIIDELLSDDVPVDPSFIDEDKLVSWFFC